MAAPFAEALAEDQRIVAEAEEVIKKHIVGEHFSHKQASLVPSAVEGRS
jgi:hypothetical protein